MTGAQRVLLEAALSARNYFDRKAHGLPSHGANEIITIGRDLHEALAAVEAEELRQLDEINLLQLEGRR